MLLKTRIIGIKGEHTDHCTTTKDQRFNIFFCKFLFAAHFLLAETIKPPFNAIYTLLSECVYGGKIDNDFDRRLLNTFLKQLFCVNSFEKDFKLVVDDNLILKMPEAAKREQFLDWVENIKNLQTPSWLGLPNSAEKILLFNYCSEIIKKLLKLSVLGEEDENALAYDAKRTTANRVEQKLQSNDSRPLWMRQLYQSVMDWLKLLHKSIKPIRRTVDHIKGDLIL